MKGAIDETSPTDVLLDDKQSFKAGRELGRVKRLKGSRKKRVPGGGPVSGGQNAEPLVSIMPSSSAAAIIDSSSARV